MIETLLKNDFLFKKKKRLNIKQTIAWGCSSANPQSAQIHQYGWMT